MDNNPLFNNWQFLQKSLENAINLRNQDTISKFINYPVNLLAISKSQNIEKIRTIAKLGQKSFGENYLQEALTKQQQLADLNLEWHFTGSIQSRKAFDIGRNFSWVHTLVNSKSANKINQGAKSVNRKINVCIQINSSNEPSKSGIDINNDNEIFALAKQIINFNNLQLRGLMTIPAFVDMNIQKERLEVQRKPYRQLREKLEMLKTCFSDFADKFDTLSMGMSDDFQAAILEGATIIRIGSSLFGNRKK